MVANELRILAKSAGHNLTEYVNSVVGVFEAPGTRSGVRRAWKDTDARRTIYNEAISSGIVGKDGIGLKEWQDFIRRCVAHLLFQFADRGGRCKKNGIFLIFTCYFPLFFTCHFVRIFVCIPFHLKADDVLDHAPKALDDEAQFFM